MELANSENHRLEAKPDVVYDISEVRTKSALKEFIDFQKNLYQKVLKSKQFVTPLDVMIRLQIGAINKPHLHLYLLKKGAQTIARLGVKVHTANGHKKLHFGFFESLDFHEKGVQWLFEQVHLRYPSFEMIGPYNFRMEDPYMGVLVEGHELAPFFMMPYNPPYYDSLLKSCGFTGVMDVFAYDITNESLQPILYERAQKCLEQGFSYRWMTKKSMKSDLRAIAKIFNEALSDNWGFEEMLDAQIQEMYLLFKFFIDPRIVCFVQKDGLDVGCLIMLPNFNEVLKETTGRLTPRTLWKILRHRRRLKSVRGYAMGILKAYQGKGIGSLLTVKTWEKCAFEMGYKTGQISWILSSNSTMNQLTLEMNGNPNRKYRIFERKPLNHETFS